MGDKQGLAYRSNLVKSNWYDVNIFHITEKSKGVDITNAVLRDITFCEDDRIILRKISSSDQI